MNSEALRVKAERHWARLDFVRVTSAHAKELGFVPEDAHLLEEIGLPQWAAPNIWIHEPSSNESEFISLGEDRDDQELLYRRADRLVIVRTESRGQLFVADGLVDFLDRLVAYAEMIDAAISACGDSVFVKNNIPSKLVDEFEDAFVKSVSVPTGMRSFWQLEVSRLRAGNALQMPGSGL